MGLTAPCGKWSYYTKRKLLPKTNNMIKIKKLFNSSEVLPGVFAAKISRYVFVDKAFFGIKWTKIVVLGYDLHIFTDKTDAVTFVAGKAKEYLLAMKYLRK